MSIEDGAKTEDSGSIIQKRMDSLNSITPTSNRLFTVTQMLTSVVQILGQTKQNVTDFISK
jgi:hypothetical protein